MRTLYLLDDDPVFITMVELTIKHVFEHPINYKVFHMPSEALAFFSLASNIDYPAIFLCDINMPGMDGFELISSLPESLQSNEAFKIHMLSSSISRIDRMKAEQHPAIHGFLTKPLTPDYLKELIVDLEEPK